MNINFCVINKPEKLLTHPRDISNEPSLLDFLKIKFSNPTNHINSHMSNFKKNTISSIQNSTKLNPKPVHRLDYETSGLIICSLDNTSEIFLKNLFMRRAVKKQYLALLDSKVNKILSIESNLIFYRNRQNLSIKGYSKNNIIKIINLKELKSLLKIGSFHPSKALSIIYPLKTKDNQTLAKLIPITGRTHQLRIHSNIINAPIIGDYLYGSNEFIASNFLSLRLLLNKLFIKSTPANINNINSYEAIEIDDNIRDSEYFKNLDNNQILNSCNNLNDIRKRLFKSPRLMLHSRKISLLNRVFIKDIDFED